MIDAADAPSNQDKEKGKVKGVPVYPNCHHLWLKTA